MIEPPVPMRIVLLEHNHCLSPSCLYVVERLLTIPSYQVLCGNTFWRNPKPQLHYELVRPDTESNANVNLDDHRYIGSYLGAALLRVLDPDECKLTYSPSSSTQHDF